MRVLYKINIILMLAVVAIFTGIVGASYNKVDNVIADEPKVVESCVIDESSVLSVDAKDGWQIKLRVTFTDATYEIVTATHSLTAEQIDGIEFIFEDVSVTNADYEVSTFVDLSRVPGIVLAYKNSVEALDGANDTALLKGLAETMTTHYNALISSYAESSELQTTLESYLTTNNIHTAKYNERLGEIVKSVDTSALENVSVNYGTYTFNKNIQVTMMDDTVVTKELTYSFEKSDISNLTATATSDGFHLVRLNGKPAYSFDESCQVTIQKLAISNIVITGKTVTYNGLAQTLQVSFDGVIESDVVNAVLSYNGQSSAINQGSYDVVIASLSGADATYYSVPAHTSAQLDIQKLEIVFNSDYENAYIYNKGVQKPIVRVTNSRGYEFSDSDYTIEYSEVNSINVGQYTITLDYGDNFRLSTSNVITYDIDEKPLTIFTLTDELKYNKTAKTLSFESSQICEGDNVEVTSFVVYDGNNSEATALNVGDYYAIITAVDNTNYIVSNVRVDFEILPAEISVRLDAQTSVYGDSIIVDDTEYTITAGNVCEGDSLGVDIAKADGNNVEEYALTATASNTNYSVTFTEGVYTITARNVSIDWSALNELALTFDNTNQYSKVTMPSINNVVNNESALFDFVVKKNDVDTTNVIDKGEYKVELTNESSLTNYNITNDTFTTFNVGKYSAVIDVDDKSMGYLLQNKNFTYQDNLMDDVLLSDLGEVVYKLYDNEDNVVSGDLQVGSYSIVMTLINRTELADNFDIDINNAVYTITASEVTIVGENLTVTYDGGAVVFTATAKNGEDNVDAELTYKYYKGVDLLETAPSQVGDYSVVVSSADENFDIESATYEIHIIKNKITLAFTGSSKQYNKVAVTTNVDATAQEGLAGDDYIEWNVTCGGLNVEQCVNVGSYIITATLTDTNNFEFVGLSTHSFEISQAEIGITLNDQNSIYSEAIVVSQTEYVVTGTVYEGDDLGIVISKEDGTDAKEYDLTAVINNANYHATITDAIYTIERKSISLVYLGEESVEYTGEELEDILSLDMTNLDGLVEWWYTNADKEEIAEPTNVGTYYVRTHLLNENYKIGEQDTIDKQFTITEQEIDIEIIAENKIYDGEVFSIDSVQDENGDVVSVALYDVQYYKGENLLLSAPTDAGDYIVKVVPKDTENYSFEATKEITIEQKTIAFEFTNNVLTYNKEVQKASANITNAVQNDDVSLIFEYVGEGFIDAGDYKITITGLTGADKDNYKFASEAILSLNYAISQLSVGVTFGETTFVYDGEIVTIGDLDISFDSELIVATDYEINELPTNVVADYAVTLSTLNDNIVFTNATTNIDVTKATIIGIILANTNVTFDGTQKSIAVNSLMLPDGNTAEVVYENNGKVDKGEYVIKATLTNANYKTLVLEATLTIKTNELALTYSGNNFDYNKTRQGLKLNTEGLASGVAELLQVKYTGVNYDSVEKPINAGTYNIVVTSTNTNNVSIVSGGQKEFVIRQMQIVVNGFEKQEKVYNSHNIEYELLQDWRSANGVFSQDDVNIVLTYGEQNETINAGTYEVKLSRLSGADAGNYSLQVATTELKILPYDIEINAEDKTIVYGESEVALTYTSDELLGDDVLSGELAREEGNDADVYEINQGTLSAGDNYTITFNTAKYTIQKRVLAISLEEDEFDYNGEQVELEISVGNILLSQNAEDVYEIQLFGDRINAGTFVAKVKIKDDNYTWPRDYIDFTITINKIDASSQILSLVASEADYTGQKIEPIVSMESVDEETLDYVLSYKQNDEVIAQIVNVGTYTVCVSIDDVNYTGNKEFSFTINPVLPTTPSVEAVTAGHKITVTLLENAVYALNDNAYQDSNVFTDLEELTTYRITVKIKAHGNYKELILPTFEATTTISTETINAQIDAIGEFDISKLSELKNVYHNYSKVAMEDRPEVDVEKIEDLIEDYADYLEVLNEDVNDSRQLAKNSLGGFDIGAFMVNIIALITLLFVIRLRIY